MTREHIISKDGTPIAVWTSGDGPPLVMVHGAMADHLALAALVPLLEPHVTVHAVDRRGRGASGDRDGYAVEREFADVAAVVDATARRSGRRGVLYGHSYGATCALGAAALTRNLAGLVLYEPGFAGVFAYPPGWLDRLEDLLAAGAVEDAVVLAMRERAGVTPAQLNAMRAAPSWAARVAAGPTIARELRFDQSVAFRAADHAGIDTPVLLLLGEHSPPGQRRVVQEIAAALPDCRIAVLAGQQHVAQVAAPQLVARELVTFVDSLRSSRAMV